LFKCLPTSGWTFVEEPNAQVDLQAELSAVHGDDHLREIDVVDRSSGTVRRREYGRLFVFIGAFRAIGSPRRDPRSGSARSANR
jgi:hypothetical protein